MKVLPSSLILISYLYLVQAISFEEDTRLTKLQGQALEKLKKRVIPKLSNDYQKEDMYLLRFLKAKGFDVPTAENYVLTEAKWREENLDNSDKEDWSDMSKDYTIRSEGFDREGRPLIVWELGDYDVRKAAVSGKMDRLVRWTFKVWDEAREKVRQAGLQGKKVTRWTMVIDLKNINPVTNVNPASLPYYLSLALGHETHWPHNADNIYLLNTPSIFQTVLSAVRPVLGKETRDALKVYGKNQAEWGPIINAAIDPSQLPQRYGGTREDP